MGDSHLREGMLLGLGNPLLDISANTSESFLEKYGLKPNDAILAEENHKSMYDEMIDNFEVEYTAGGACQNTMRVAQWILGKPNIASFMGCIGRDKFGDILETKAKESGVNTFYQYHETIPTGTCAVVITNKGANRSLCANLSAANNFVKDHIDKPENRAMIEKADYFYITGFFLTVSPPSMLDVATYACSTNKIFSMNLSAPFLSEFFEEPMMKIMPYVDILFGNEQEARTFSRVHNFGTDKIEEIALKICALPKENKQRSRITIITQGKDPVVLAYDGVVNSFPAMNIKQEDIIDTNGAGDAFVGGFLAQYVQQKPLEVCIKCGIYAATEVIKQSGCAFPTKPAFNEA